MVHKTYLLLASCLSRKIRWILLLYTFYHVNIFLFVSSAIPQTSSSNKAFLWTSKNSPKNDVCMWTDVFASIHSSDPGGPRSYPPLSKTVIRKFFQVPRVRFKHVINTITTKGHDHFCAGLKKSKPGENPMRKAGTKSEIVQSQAASQALNSGNLGPEPLLFIISIPYHLPLFLERLGLQVTEVRAIYSFFVNCFLSHLLLHLIFKTTLERNFIFKSCTDEGTERLRKLDSPSFLCP